MCLSTLHPFLCHNELDRTNQKISLRNKWSRKNIEGCVIVYCCDYVALRLNGHLSTIKILLTGKTDKTDNTYNLHSLLVDLFKLARKKGRKKGTRWTNHMTSRIKSSPGI